MTSPKLRADMHDRSTIKVIPAAVLRLKPPDPWQARRWSFVALGHSSVQQSPCCAIFALPAGVRVDEVFKKS